VTLAPRDKTPLFAFFAVAENPRIARGGVQQPRVTFDGRRWIDYLKFQSRSGFVLRSWNILISLELDDEDARDHDSQKSDYPKR
jgi:hypothetical protein